MRLIYCALLGTTVFVSSGEANERIVTLSSASRQVERKSFEWSSAAPKGAAGAWSVSKRILKGGRQSGVSLISIDNGRIKVDVIPTRGMSILAVSDSKTGKRIFGWDSPVNEIVHPSYIDLESRGGLGWLEGFNECMVRCGLEFAGHPGVDKFTTNTGDTAEMNLTLHGKIGNIPASEVELIVETDGKAVSRVKLRGIVNERMFFGPKLELVTELVMEAGSPTIQLHDVVTNHGSSAQEYQLIYHANFGAPILEEGAVFHAAIREVRPMNETAASGMNTMTEYAAPTPGYLEQVFLIEPYADAEGNSTAVLHNATADLGATVTWAVETLPYLTVWKNTVAAEDGYVTGIEPATGYPFNRRVERKYGRVPKLEAGASKEFRLSLTVLDSAAAVTTAVQDVPQASPMSMIADPPSTTFDED